MSRLGLVAQAIFQVGLAMFLVTYSTKSGAIHLPVFLVHILNVGCYVLFQLAAAVFFLCDVLQRKWKYRFVLNNF
jgi:hypothetical protein